MNRKIILNICVLSVFLVSPIYAQEIITSAPIELIIVEEEDSLEITDVGVEEEISINVIPIPDFAIPVSEIVIHSPNNVIPAEVGIQTQDTNEDLLIDEITIATNTTHSSGTQLLFVPEFSTSTEFTEVAPTTLEIATSSVHILIRNGIDIVYEGNVDIKEDKKIAVVDSEGKPHDVLSTSALGVLLTIDESNDNFEITTLKFYPFVAYLSCVTVRGEELCENWQYRLNGFSPWDSIDASLIKSGDDIGLYFGNSSQIVFATSTYETDVPFSAIAQEYDYKTNTWNPRTEVTIGVVTPDPLNPWTPIVLATYPVDQSGQSILTIATSSAYQIGIEEDYYFPTYSIFVSTSTTTTTGGTATTTATSTLSGSVGGSGSASITKSFDINKAIVFLKNLQDDNGSYGGATLYSDWVALALSAKGEQDNSLLEYIQDTAKIQNIVTDNERRAMALLALGQDPYDFEGVNYIEAIVKEFDGIQFGEKQLVNDDIFALIVLSKTGYKSTDIEIQKSIEFILSKQNSNGSWEQSVDLTAAAIQALTLFKNNSGVSASVTKAENYLKNSQQADGGWGNVYATSWALQAMNSLSKTWEKNGNSPEEYLTSFQQTDGGLLLTNETLQNRIWATSYAIPAVLGKSWDDILNSVSRPQQEDNTSNQSTGGGSETNSTSTPATIIESEELSTEEDIEEFATTLSVPTEIDAVDEYINSNTSAYTNTTTLPGSDVQEQAVELINEEVAKEQVSDQQLASISQILWLKSWWVYVLGGIMVLGGGLMGLRRVW